MAGDWIKMRSDLGTHPKIVRISSALKADRLRVVGGLHAVWCLFDVHSVDGKLEGYTPDALDDLIGWSGFSAAMIAVDWLESDGESLTTPGFDEHNGQSAKRRAQEAERKRCARLESELSASDADKLRTREEKRREEKEKKEPKSKAESARASRLPADWHPTDVEVEFCKTERPDLRPSIVATRFFDYWIAQPGAKGRKVDWSATWRNWVRNEKLQPGPRASVGAPMDLASAQRAANDEAKRRLGIPVDGGNERMINAIQ